MSVGLSSVDSRDAQAADVVARWLAVFERLTACSRHLRRELACCAGHRHLSDVEFLLLWQCHCAMPNGLGQTELAAAVTVSTAQISGLVEQLRARGLITGCRDAHDRRRQVWQLTPAGRELLAQVLADLQPLADRLLPCWNDGANEAMERLIAECGGARHPHPGPLPEGEGEKERTSPKPKLRLAGTLLILLACLLSGCTRAYYRRWADNEIYDLVREKAQDPRWSLSGYTINIDPRSRMYDPACPDFELEPPDDPAASQLMKCVDGMRGDAVWDWYGDTPYVQNPEWDAALPRNERGEVVVDLTQAVQLALLNSRDYQREMEQLYLSALDVSFERFRFDVQFFGNNSTAYEVAGPMAPGAAGSSSSILRNDTAFESRKLFASGGEFVVGLANSLVWQFSGSDSQFSTTLLDFSMIQPLLRGGGRAVVLERLTLGERVLLYNVRAMERYRRGFFTQVFAGNNPGDGPNRRGGVFGGAGLEGFTGTGGGFGTVTAQAQQQQQQATGNFGVTGGAGAGLANGYLGLLQRQQEIRNQQSNVAALGGSVAQLDAAYAAGRIDRFQVDLARQALYNAQSRLMTDMTNYDNQVDNFKVQFGMPPQLTMLIRDGMLEPFELIDSRLAPLQNRITRLQARLGDLIVALRDDARDPATLGTPQFREKVAQLRQALAQAMESQRAATSHIPEVRKDIAEFRANVPRRRESLDLLLRRARQGLTGESTADTELDRIAETELFANRDAIDADIKRLTDLPAKLDDDLAAVEKAFAKIPPLFQQFDEELHWLEEHAAEAGPVDAARRLNAVLGSIPDHLLDLYGDILELSLVQARARTEKIVLVPIDMESSEAIRIARCNRLDWMNARATLVDRWRLIEFNANALESELNLSISGDVQNASDTPFAFNNSTGRLQMGVQFDAPLTRLAERNNYRQALIEFQQARRDYYNFTDRVAQSLRLTLRQIELDQANFELRRAAVRVAIDQVDITQLRLREPPLPGATAEFSNTTARDLVTALADLLNVQNDYLSVWVNYEVQRVLLDFNLETMRLDEFGMWVDPGSNIGQEGKACFGLCCDDDDTLHAADARCNRLFDALGLEGEGIPAGTVAPNSETVQPRREPNEAQIDDFTPPDGESEALDQREN